MEKRNKNKKSGFTLIELVVVIAIIGVLAAVITPRIRTALYKAKDAKAIAALDALRTASNVYYAETGGTLTATGGGNLTLGIVKTLENKGYLDSRGAKNLGVVGATTETDATAVAVEVGSNGVAGTTAGTCTTVPNTTLGIIFDTDKIGMKFNAASTALDASCSPWADK